MKKSTLTLAILGSASLLISSCNTAVGVGQDFRRFGEGVENTARGKTWTGKTRQPRSTYTPPSSAYTPQ